MPNLTSLKPLLAIVVFYLLAFWLSLSYWAFRDARERSNSVLFHVFATGLSLVLPIFGLFLDQVSLHIVEVVDCHATLPPLRVTDLV